LRAEAKGCKKKKKKARHREGNSQGKLYEAPGKVVKRPIGVPLVGLGAREKNFSAAKHE